MRPHLSRLLPATTALLTPLAFLALGAAPGTAGGPNGGTVVGGSATITGQGSSAVIVNQSSGRAIINWTTFNLGTGDSIRFNQPGSSAIALNRVVGGLGPSEILGTLTANGRVFVINRDGILFGRGAVINTAGFLATTHDIRNVDFMAGRFNFNIPGRPDASIVNLGRITATSGGFAALVAPGVRNSGTITATLGTVGLAAANGFTLDLYGDRLITLAVDDQIAAKVIDLATGQPLKSLVSNDGTIKANGGRVELTAAAVRTVVDSVINTSGVVKANSIGRNNGMIVLSAATGATKGAGAPAQTIKVSGTLSAAGKKKGTTGGTILVTGEDIAFVGALVDASGRTGGGRVLIGGDWGGGRPAAGLVSNPSARLENFLVPTATTVSVDAGTTIDASAKNSGGGGKVILWSDQTTTFAGTIFARGGTGGGAGGFVETSGHRLAFTGTVDTRAPNGAAGTLLLDPADYYIVATLGGSPDGASEITGTQVQNLLANGHVVIATDNNSNPYGQSGDIFVNDGISWSNTNSLTLSAFRNININADITNTSAAGAPIILRADNTGIGVGTVNFTGDPYISTQGRTSIYYNPPGYTDPQDDFFSGYLTGGGTLAAYMLVNSAADLANIGTNLGGTYALGRPIDGASATVTPIGSVAFPFTGTFDGDGHAIANFTIQATGAGDTASGLFAAIGATGVVRNLALSNITVNANTGVTGPGQFLGTLAGMSSGKISNVTTSGSVNGGTMTGVIAGGLVGQNGILGQNNPNTTITESNAQVAVTVGDGISCNGNNSCNGGMNNAGGLVGFNAAGIDQSWASGSVIVGADSFAGGLVGTNQNQSQNQNGNQFLAGPLISASFATGNVTSAGTRVALGGLVGFNAPLAVITSSYATGNVTSTASIPLTSPDCSTNGTCQFANGGGLVGQNFGTIAGTTDLPSLSQACGIGQTCAAGAVGMGSNSTGGGLVGFNDGIIVNAFATGNITGAAGLNNLTGDGGATNLGGLAGTNRGLISGSHARGNVGTPGVANLQLGGLVSDNSGMILDSIAIGNVQGGDGSSAGGLTSNNGPQNFNCGNFCIAGDGYPFFNTAFIGASQATGNVTVGAASLAGGFAGSSDGTIAYGFATGAVSGGGNSVLGGFIGALSDIGGAILQSSSAGAVSSSGPNSVVGGFVGVTGGTILLSDSSGTVTGTGESHLGGFAGMNLGLVQQSFTTTLASVAGTVDHNIMGGFVGANFGLIDQSTSGGGVTGGTNSVVGGFAGANARFVNFPSGSIPLSSFPTGTITNSAAAGTATGGAGSTVDPFVGVNNPTAGFGLPQYPSIVAACDAALCFYLNTGLLPTTDAVPNTDVLQNLPPQQLVTNNLVNRVQLAALNTAPVVTVTLPRLPASPPPQVPPGFGPRIVDIPPLTETRFIADHVVVQIAAGTDPARLQDAFARLGLTLLATQNLGTTGSIALQLRIGSGQSVRDIIRALAANQIAAAIQPNYVYVAGQAPADDPAPASRGEAGQPQGDAAQYILQKLRLSDVHRIVKGADIPIAVIDSEIDAAHPDLAGVVVQRFSAVGAPEAPHAHGTGMAGAIASRQRLLGTAPSARLLAVHAFSSKAATAESTTFNILKGIDWAVSQGARVINMSFAGPKDPSLERALKAAYNKGVVLIAAAGNAGPKSPPLYPGADPNVIAVTATDVDDKIFSGANRGKYIAVAAPGVDILVPAPDGAYQITTGTSVAAAEVSGIVALLLERNPQLTPADIRRILTSSARRLAAGERDDNFGSGLVDPLNALRSADPPTATTTQRRR